MFYDLQKAFDSVHRDDIDKALTNKRLPEELVQTVKLLNTSQAMKVENLMMPWIPMTKGVRQGSPLSPLLFNIFLSLLNPDNIDIQNKPDIRFYADDIVVLCSSAEEAYTIDRFMNEQFSRLGLTINYGPDKSCYMQTSPLARKFTEKIGKLERVENYQYLGSLVSTDKNNRINLRSLTKAQSSIRYSKIRGVARKFAWMLANKKTNASTVNDLIISLTRGNLFGLINPHTNLTFDHRTKVPLTSENGTLLLGVSSWMPTSSQDGHKRRCFTRPQEYLLSELFSCRKPSQRSNDGVTC